MDKGELENFIEKALECQLGDPDVPLSPDQLKDIALRAGLSEKDWDQLCDEVEARVSRGKNFVQFENGQDAVKELDTAVDLAPYRSDILYLCGRAHHLCWEKHRRKVEKQKTIELYTRCLQIDPGHLEASKFLSEIKDPPAKPRQTRKKFAIAGIIACLLLASGLFYFEKPSAQTTENTVETPKIDTTEVVQSSDTITLGDRRFQIFYTDIPWHEAKRRCEEMGGRLAIVEDQTTLDSLNKLKGGKRLWLGATDEAKEGEWRWVDGRPVTFNAWSERQPFNMMGREHYMELGPKGGFNDVGEDGPSERWRIQGFICEWPTDRENPDQNMQISAAN